MVKFDPEHAELRYFYRNGNLRIVRDLNNYGSNVRVITSRQLAEIAENAGLTLERARALEPYEIVRYMRILNMQLREVDPSRRAVQQIRALERLTNGGSRKEEVE